jgi:ribulose-phosphate 3-epimerase
LIIPAIIAETQDELGTMLSSLQDKAGRVMLDFMDGVFVPSRSLMFEPLLPAGFEYEAHLMVHNPIEYIQKLSDKVKIIQFHVESVENVDKVVEKAGDHGYEVYLALNPDTSVTRIQNHLEIINGVLVLTVQPGRYGGRFLPYALEKIKKLKEMRDDLTIEVDGGMNPMTAKLAKKAGADIFASGSYIMESGDIDEAIKRLQSAVL